MNNHAGWGTDGLCVLCGASEPQGDCDPRAVIDALRAEVARLKADHDRWYKMPRAEDLAKIKELTARLAEYDGAPTVAEWRKLVQAEAEARSRVEHYQKALSLIVHPRG
jgi:hypothetical protein